MNHSGKLEDYLMPTHLTLTSNSCNRGNPAGDHSMVRKPGRTTATIAALPGEGKTHMVKAKLPEPQTQYESCVLAHRWFMCQAAWSDGIDHAIACSNRADYFPREAKGRTRHLTASYLLECVTAGSPKRAALPSPAWRRNRHISQMPGVTPRTASHGWTDTVETDRATDRGIPSIRVKGGASTEDRTFRTACEAS